MEKLSRPWDVPVWISNESLFLRFVDGDESGAGAWRILRGGENTIWERGQDGPQELLYLERWKRSR